MTRRTTGNEPDHTGSGKRGDISEVAYHGDSWGSVRLIGHDLSYRVRFDTGDGGPYVTELHINSPSHRPITSEDLRSIPLRRIASAVAGEEMLMTYRKITGATDDPRTGSDASPTRRQITDDLLREVSHMARLVHSGGQRVRENLAEHFHVSPFTIDKWLAKAREAGHLRPGELSTKTQVKQGD